MRSVFCSVPVWELNLELCVRTGQVFRWHAFDGGWAGMVDDVLLVVMPFGTRWQVSALGAEPMARFRHLFRLEQDLKRVHTQLVRREPRWESWIRALPGLRLLRWSNPEACLFSFLCTPANNLPRIVGMIERLCTRYGALVGEWGGRRWHAFPPAAVLAQAQETDLRALGFGYRARVIIQVAQALIACGSGWLEQVRSLPYWEAKQALLELPGVGAKIADCVLLFGLDQPLAVPIDTHMWQAMQKWVLPELRDKTLTERTYRQIVDWFHDRFGEWTGWAHQYLFTAHLLGLESL